MGRGYVDAVEAAYDLRGDDTTWVKRMLEPLAPLLGEHGAVAWYGDSPQFESGGCATWGTAPEVGAAGERFFREAPQILTALLSSRPMGVGVASDDLSPLGIDLSATDAMVRISHPIGMTDGLMLRATCPSGVSLLVGAPQPTKPAPFSPKRRARLERVAAHALTALRLRRALGTKSEDAGDAVLRPDGAVAHAEGEATNAGVLEALREAVRNAERARTRQGRSDTDAALAAWQALVAGRWTLVDRFDSDGRRYLVARRNDPSVDAPAAITRREAQITGYIALGRTQQQIAYELGLAASTVNTSLSATMSKLGIHSRAELIRLFAPWRASNSPGGGASGE